MAVSNDHALSDGQFVYGPNVGDFNLKDYLAARAPHLLKYAEDLYGRAEYFSINPKIYLTLLEVHSHLVSIPDAAAMADPLGLKRGTFISQIDYLSNTMTDAYYLHRSLYSPWPASQRDIRPLVTPRGVTVDVAPDTNAGTYAILAGLAAIDQQDIPSVLDNDNADGFWHTYVRLFGNDDPLDESNQIDIPETMDALPAPANLLQLPYLRGLSWRFGGVHNTAGGTAFTDASALDFFPGGGWGMDTSSMWVVAGASGTPTKISACYFKVSHSNGWETTYYHLENIQSYSGSINQNDKIGVIANTEAEAICSGGAASGPHVHFSLKHNGAYVAINGTPLSGWYVHSGRYSYDTDPNYMWLERAGLTKYANRDSVLSEAPVAVSVGGIVPAYGSNVGGTSITLTGTGFLTGATVALGGAAATAVTVVNTTTITATTPAHAAGAVDVVVTNPDTQTGALVGGFTYTMGTPTLLSVAPSTLRFAGTNTGGALSPITPAQSVMVSFSGPTPSPWIATANHSWVQITNGSGTGSATFTVGIVNPGNLLGKATSATATITVTSSGASNPPQSITVDLTLRQAAANVAPFGMVDTPLQNTTGLIGSIGVTGWALDDVGVQSVKLYRNCLAFEPAANCAMVGGYNLVYMGDADVVPGARPDVEAAYPGYPQASRAGWGYLLLTNMLPHIPKQLMYGGQGTLSIYVFATDVEGHIRLLGRQTVSDQTATTVSMANDAAGKPFGAIDSPGQGETVSGTVNNWGWALTPDTNTAGGDGSDILVPTNGLTTWVWIDGAPVGHPLLNLCRGSGGVNPTVPAEQHCDDDVANIFGNPTPQPTFQLRTANVSKYRNLDAARGAIGVYTFDTRTLSNGRHSIVWGVTDTAGRVDGIGSRDFIVLNSGASDARSGATALAQDRSDRGARAAERLSDAPAEPRGAARPVEGLAPAAGVVRGRTGFDLGASLEGLAADEAGVRHVRLAPLDRLELWLGAVDAGYLVANGTLRDLPPGSHLEPASGLFTWTPGVAYFGTYRLAFVRGGEQIAVDVTIRPIEGAAPGEAAIRMHVDTPSDGAVVSGPFTVAGWALDPQASIGSGIATVHVWAQRRDVPTAEAQFLGVAALGGVRPDVAAVFGPQFGTAGFSLTTDRLEPGQYDITAYVWNRRTARWEDARTVSITVR